MRSLYLGFLLPSDKAPGEASCPGVVAAAPEARRTSSELVRTFDSNFLAALISLASRASRTWRSR
jgi:hypothetical protein